MPLTAGTPSSSQSGISKSLKGGMPSKQLKMLLGRAALHQDELLENWALAKRNQELFPIDPLR